ASLTTRIRRCTPPPPGAGPRIPRCASLGQGLPGAPAERGADARRADGIIARFLTQIMPATAPSLPLTLETPPSAAGPTDRSVVRSLPLVDLGLALATGLAALAVRLPNLLTIPRF